MGGITAIAGVVVTVVFSVLQLMPSDDGTVVPKPADELLELVDLDFAAQAVEIPVIGEMEVGVESLQPVPPGETSTQHPLVLTLRNPSDDPAVLTGLKVVVHEIRKVDTCGEGIGGGVNPSLGYDFRFPHEMSEPWEQVNPQNFAVNPHAVDALSVTVGPDVSSRAVLMWRFSVYGVLAGDRQVHWADGVAAEEFDESSSYRAYVWGEFSAAEDAVEPVRACAARTVEELTAFAAPGQARSFVTHPAVEQIVAAYRSAAAPGSTPE